MDIETPWRLVKTPSPREFGFVTSHDPDILLGTSEEGDNAWPIEGETLYKNWRFREQSRVLVWGDYILSDGNAGDDGRLVFSWGKNKPYDPTTGLDPKNEPFRVVPYVDGWSWDPVLKKVEPYPDFYNTRSSRRIQAGGAEALNNGPEYYAAISFIAGGNYSTRFLKYEYYAATKFDIPNHRGPVPTAVVIMLPGREAISFPRCLHKKITTPRLITSSSVSVADVTQAAGGSTSGLVFPSTAPFEQWQAYVVEHKQEQREAGWYAWKIVALPPQEPEVIVQRF